MLIIIQAVLIFFKKSTKNTDLYIITDTVFKLSVAIYLLLLFIIYPFPGIEFEDRLIIQFSAVVLVFDIDYIDLIHVLHKYFPFLPAIPYIEKEFSKN
jgi:hypothetical protein